MSRGQLALIDLHDKLAQIDRPWTPHIVGELNGQHVKLAKLDGAFEWHHHDHEDELFLVLDGKLRMEVRGGAGEESAVDLTRGQIYIVPAGVEHRPVAEPTCSILLFEPAGTLNTGTVESERTVAEPDWL